MDNIVVVAIVVIIIACAIAYVVKEKKKGIKCIGCPNAKSCSMAQKQKCNGISDCNNKNSK